MTPEISLVNVKLTRKQNKHNGSHAWKWTERANTGFPVANNNVLRPSCISLQRMRERLPKQTTSGIAMLHR